MYPNVLRLKLFFASAFILLCALPQGLIAGEQAAASAKTFTYDKNATERLKEIFTTIRNDWLNSRKNTYDQYRGEISNLICGKNANPIAQIIHDVVADRGYIVNMLGEALLRQDVAMVETCLCHGASANSLCVSHSWNDYAALNVAKSAETARLLIDKGATIPEHILDFHVTTRSSAEMLAFFGNCGADAGDSNSILEKLFFSPVYTDEKAAILFWFNASDISCLGRIDRMKDSHHKKRLERLSLLKEIVPAAKNAQFDGLLKPYIAKDPAGIVREYTGSHIGWDDSCFPDIERRMKQAEIAKKAAARKKLAEENTNECSVCSIS